jgi:hypothetical protein
LINADNDSGENFLRAGDGGVREHDNAGTERLEFSQATKATINHHIGMTMAQIFVLFARNREHPTANGDR